MDLSFIPRAVISAAIGSLVGAVFLRASAHWVAKQNVSFGNAFGTVFAAAILSNILGFAIGLGAGLIFSSNPEIAVSVASLLTLPIGYLVLTAFVASRNEVSFGKACLITLTMVALGILLVGFIGAMIVLVSILL